MFESMNSFTKSLQKKTTKALQNDDNDRSIFELEIRAKITRPCRNVTTVCLVQTSWSFQRSEKRPFYLAKYVNHIKLSLKVLGNGGCKKQQLI